MKKVLFLLCTLSMAVLLSACSGDNGGSSGGGGNVQRVSYDIIAAENVVCYNANDNLRQDTKLTCTWNCGEYNGRIGRVTLVFDYDDTNTYALIEATVGGAALCF